MIQNKVLVGCKIPKKIETKMPKMYIYKTSYPTNPKQTTKNAQKLF